MGPGNGAADAWVLLHEVDQPHQPFIVYVGSKQRKGKESVSDTRSVDQIEDEAKKDSFEPEPYSLFSNMYIYLTDEYANNDSSPDPDEILAISAQQHEMHYGMLNSLLTCLRE